MSRLSIPIILFVLLLSLNVWAQKKVETVTCPNIFLSGPAGIVNPGEVGNYTLTFKRLNLWGRYTFTWSVKGGELVDGQGTEHARVKFGTSPITVTVAVSGQPKGCPSTFTDSGIIDLAPDPLKIFELQPDTEMAESEIALLVSEHTKNPNNQIYILVGHLYGKASPGILKKEAAVRASLIKAGIPTTFITFKSVYAEAELMQFWRVPPGASNPTCKECEKLAMCPKISITGPAGNTMPGETAMFKAEIPKEVVGDLRFDWKVSAGEIETGQGTPEIVVRTSREDNGKTITASVAVVGFSKECENSSEASANVFAGGDPILVDEIFGTNERTIRSKLDRVSKELSKHPSHELVILMYWNPKELIASVTQREAFIRSYLETKLGIAPTRLIFMRGGETQTMARIYMAPAGTIRPSK